MKQNTTNKPLVVMVPFLKKWWVQLAQAHGQVLMYWTEATASMGIKVIKEIQLAQEAMKPTSEPWLYWANLLIPPDSGNMVPSSI